MSVDQKFLLWRGTIGSLLSNNYLYLLLSLSSVLVLWPMMQPLSVWAGVLEGMLILTLGFCIFAASRRPGQIATSVVLALIAVSLRFGEVQVDLPVAYSDLLYGTFFSYASVLIVMHIFTDNERVNINLVYGAISVYLLIGLAFALFYAGLEELDPGSFSGLNLAPGPHEVFLQAMYFSFVTLATLGYGDILPVSDLSRPLAYTEAIIGQLYLTVLVARLVGMHLRENFRS